jgi:hypothetical protein
MPNISSPADVWGVQLLCLEFMRSVMGEFQHCILLEFPMPLCGIRNLPCATTTQILELEFVGDACQACKCHDALVQGPPDAGEISAGINTSTSE